MLGAVCANTRVKVVDVTEEQLGNLSNSSLRDGHFFVMNTCCLLVAAGAAAQNLAPDLQVCNFGSFS